jgi:hypothetical protein
LGGVAFTVFTVSVYSRYAVTTIAVIGMASTMRADFSKRLDFIHKKRPNVRTLDSRTLWAQSDLEWDAHGQLCFDLLEDVPTGHWNHTWAEREARVGRRYGCCGKLFKDPLCQMFSLHRHKCDECFDEARNPQFKFPTTTWGGVMALFKTPDESVRNKEWGVRIAPPEGFLPSPPIMVSVSEVAAD